MKKGGYLLKASAAWIAAMLLVIGAVSLPRSAMAAETDQRDKSITGLGTGAIRNPRVPEEDEAEADWQGSYVCPRAFADCDKLMTISIPATVEHIDDTALDGCKYIIAVYGETGSEAERFANDNGCVFISMNPDPNPTYRTSESPVVLPYVAFN